MWKGGDFKSMNDIVGKSTSTDSQAKLGVAALERHPGNSYQKMVQVNARQKDFYESWFKAVQMAGVERAANTPTGTWSWMRRKLLAMRKLAGLDEYLEELHRGWMHDLENARVLDLGCFTGNPLSLWIAENCAEYTGIDLSEQAVAVLNAKLSERQFTHARAYAQDFLANSYPDNHFDLIYANSVLHHFKDINLLLAELHRILKPGGMVISFDPLMTEPLNRLARALYRPLQTDRDWEWPFTRKTFGLLRRYFEIADRQGIMGMVKFGFLCQLVLGPGKLGNVITRLGLKFDKKYARHPGAAFFFCWQATLLLRKRDSR